jgi:GT2 family glycosyltransferase
MTPALSVVIPTFDRRDALLHTLCTLARQHARERAEVIVVDNGSSDGTREAVAERHPDVKLLHQPKRGPAAARNLGVAGAAAPLVLFLGDDMAPAGDGLLAAHLALHEARPDPLYAVLGRATWRPDREVTPYMHWLENGGPQFDFPRLQAGPVPAATHFITAHLSLKRESLEPFDERFPYAAVEDAELGIRLQARGLVLDYRPELLVHHDHPTPQETGVRRMEKVGESARLLHAIHPDTSHFPRPNGRWRLYPAAAAAARALLRARPPQPLRERAWTVLTLDAYARGYRRGRLS